MQSLIERRLSELKEEYIHSEVIEDAIYLLEPLPDDFITKSNLCPDGVGGLSIEWSNHKKEITLRLTPNTTYLYHENGQDHDLFYNVQRIDMVRWLRWLYNGKS